MTEVYGRKIRDDLRPGTPLHLYLPGPHRGVWNVEALAVAKEVVLCEALIDALTLWCAGYRNVTAAYGVEGFTEDHLAAFEHHGTERVLIAYDRDDAGERAAPAAPKTSKRLRVSAEPAVLAHNALTHYQAAFHEWEAVVDYSPRTIVSQRHAIGRFLVQREHEPALADMLPNGLGLEISLLWF